MSGGVDSSAAALLLLRQGYEVIGCTCKMFVAAQAGLDKESRCCALSDIEDARLVASRLGIKHLVYDCTDVFRECVMEHFAAEYSAGRTPNPCVDCNREVKFGELLEYARELGCDYLATGHYARVERDSASGRYTLRRGVDLAKDQSYMLYSLTQEQLAHVLFPLGGMLKTEIRALAAEQGFVNARKPDSQDICFVPDGDYARVVARLTGNDDKPGDFVHLDGTVLGRHKGFVHYTIGQRKGLGIAYAYPLFVVRKDAAANRIYVGPRQALEKNYLLAKQVNLIMYDSVKDFAREISANVALKASVQTRYHQRELAAELSAMSDGRVRVAFKTPQTLVTPGQAVVFYKGDCVIGGGIIDDFKEAQNEA